MSEILLLFIEPFPKIIFPEPKQILANIVHKITASMKGNGSAHQIQSIGTTNIIRDGIDVNGEFVKQVTFKTIQGGNHCFAEFYFNSSV